MRFLTVKLNDNDDEVAKCFDICIFDYDLDFSRWWWLRSTTGPYGRTFLEAADGKIMIHSTEAVWVM